MFQYRYSKWNKKIYIAKKIGTTTNDYGYDISVYSEPKEYLINVQPISSEADIQEFGEHAKEMQKAVLEKSKYLDEFKEFDVAYLDGATPEGESYYGEKANYRLYPPRNQNKVIQIFFRRLAKE